MTDRNIEQEKTVLRVKLDNLASALKKLADVFLQIQSNTPLHLVEPQIINRMRVLANNLISLKSLEEKNEGEVFAAFLKSIFDVIQSIGVLTRTRKDENVVEQLTKVLKGLKYLEAQIKELLPVVVAIDEKRKMGGYETFGGLMQRVVDAVHEKRHLLLRDKEGA